MSEHPAHWLQVTTFLRLECVDIEPVRDVGFGEHGPVPGHTQAHTATSPGPSTLLFYNFPHLQSLWPRTGSVLHHFTWTCGLSPFAVFIGIVDRIPLKPFRSTFIPEPARHMLVPQEASWGESHGDIILSCLTVQIQERLLFPRPLP